MLVQNLEEVKNFWRKYLGNILECDFLPKSFNNEKNISQDYEETEILPIELNLRIDEVCKEYKLKKSILILGAWAILMNYYSGNDDIALYTNIHFFEEMKDKQELIPFRFKINNKHNAMNFLYNVTQEYEKLQQYANISVQEVHREFSKGKKFNVIIFEDNYLNEYGEMNKDNFNVQFYVSFKDSIKISAKIYDNEIEKESIRELFDNFITLLESIIKYSNMEICKFNILSSSAMQKIIYDFNATSADYQKDKCIQELFEEQVAQIPNKIAAVYEDEEITYKQLNDKANKLAHYLRRKGVSVGKFVGVLNNRSINSILSILAILKTGGVYVPLDAEYSKSRLEYMLSDAKPVILLTQESFKYRIPEEYKNIVITLDSDWTDIDNEEQSNLKCHNTLEDLAYVNYTSGSTGQPKGVIIPHKGVTRLVQNTNYIKISEDDCFLHESPISFDASTFEIWGALCNGGKIVIINKDTLLSTNAFSNIIDKYGVTTMFLTTCIFNTFVQQCPEIYSKVKNVITGGDVVSLTHFKKAIANAKDTKFIHAYGPTENTTFSCCYKVIDIPSNINTIPIGKPISNSTAYILDKYLRPLPIGVRGEIYVGGEGLAKGYLNMNDKTSEVFISNPFSDNDGCKLYKTGDLGRWLPTGNIEFCGRIDNQVKIRGFRIELGEIENALLSIEGIKNCFVMPSEGSSEQKRLLAYFIADVPIMHKDILKELKKLLPEYMIPNEFIQIESLPMTANNKVDRGRLKEYVSINHTENNETMLPRNIMESTVAKVWADVLDRGIVGIKDNFFDIGGDSLLIMKIAEKLEKVLNKEVPIVVLFQHTTVEALAKYLINDEMTKSSLSDRLNSKLKRLNRV